MCVSKACYRGGVTQGVWIPVRWLPICPITLYLHRKACFAAAAVCKLCGRWFRQMCVSGLRDISRQTLQRRLLNIAMMMTCRWWRPDFIRLCAGETTAQLVGSKHATVERCCVRLDFRLTVSSPRGPAAPMLLASTLNWPLQAPRQPQATPVPLPQVPWPACPAPAKGRSC